MRSNKNKIFLGILVLLIVLLIFFIFKKAAVSKSGTYFLSENIIPQPPVIVLAFLYLKKIQNTSL